MGKDMEDTMKILIIEDNHIHQEAAKAQLKDYETTVVGTYDEGQKLVQEKHEFDVVLVDLFMPASGQAIAEPSGTALVGQEMPVGIFLALLAAKNGAKYVAVFTDSDHHSHPASACFDAFNPGHETEPISFTVAGAKMVLCNARSWIQNFYREDLSRVMRMGEYNKEQAVRAKNWHKLLDYLIAKS